MTGETIAQAINSILAICGGLAILYGGISAITKMLSPYKRLEETVNRHSKILDNDNKRLEYMEESNKLTLKCMMVLIDHQLTGNGVDSMKALKKEINDFLLDK